MLSLATRLPKRFVIPRSSRCTCVILPGFRTGRTEWPARFERPGAARLGLAPRRRVGVTVSRSAALNRGNLDAALDDALSDLVKLRLGFVGDLRVPLAEVGDAGALVLQRPFEIAGRCLTRGRLGDELLDVRRNRLGDRSR